MAYTLLVILCLILAACIYANVKRKNAQESADYSTDGDGHLASFFQHDRETHP